MLDAKKLTEWRKWGKEAFVSNRNNMRRNKQHPDYDTTEKTEALHDSFDSCYMLSQERKEKLISPKWNYTEADYEKAVATFKEGYAASRAWYKKADAKFQAIIDKFSRIWTEAERIAKETDVSDIQDGFPCGSAHLYLDDYAEGYELRKALAHFSDSDSIVYKYQLPIKMPSYGQCISYDERICEAVREYLRSEGIFANIHSWID